MEETKKETLPGEEAATKAEELKAQPAELPGKHETGRVKVTGGEAAQRIPVGPVDIFTELIQKQDGKHYRMISKNPLNVDRKRLQGYEIVKGDDPEVKDGPLEKHVKSDNTVGVGTLMLGRTSKEQHERNVAEVQKRTDRKLRAIKGDYLTKGEGIKRELGGSHKAMEFFAEEE